MNETHEKLFEQWKAFALKIAGNYASRRGLTLRRLLPYQIQQAALIGLWDAIQKFKTDKACSFKSYAIIRIIGSIEDEMRSTKSWRRRFKDVPDMISVGMKRSGPTTSSIQEIVFGAPEKKEQFQPIEDRDCFDAAMKCLDLKERKFIALYVEDGLTYRQIGKRIGLSESRVCQISKAVFTRLREWAAKQP